MSKAQSHSNNYNEVAVDNENNEASFENLSNEKNLVDNENADNSHESNANFNSSSKSDTIIDSNNNSNNSTVKSNISIPELNIYSLNSANVEQLLNNIECQFPENFDYLSDNQSKEVQSKLCYNIGTCELLEPSKDDKKGGKRGKCIFDKIFCNNDNCYQDNGCDISYVKYAKPQYLRPCEKNPKLIIETCIYGDQDCVTRNCSSNDQCLSGVCINNTCYSNSENPVRLCSYYTADDFNKFSNEFSCNLFQNERCINGKDCFTKHCGKVSGQVDEHNEPIKYCLERNVTFVNAMACLLAYAVVVITLLVLHSIYKHTKKTKTH